MCVRLLAFVLLITFPAVLHAQKAEQPCVAPQLDGGDFIPKKETYPHEKKLIYACDEGYKPTAEGWWATSTCENGQWSPKPQCIAQKVEQLCIAPQLDGGDFMPKKETYPHEKKLIFSCDEGYKLTAEGWYATTTCENGQWSPKPQCIDETSCLPPTIPNGNYLTNSNGWYPEHSTITVTCDDGYELKGQSERIRCVNGTWPPLPICEKSPKACDEPPQIPHAVITERRHQKVFNENSTVVYECEGGYTTDGITTLISVFCSSGRWTGIPTCQVFCLIDPKDYFRQLFEVTKLQYLRNGESKNFRCPPYPGYYSILRCTNRRITYTNCCHEHTINHGGC